jgi:CubicO group peptidase (beta-lactamase class C family)
MTDTHHGLDSRVQRYVTRPQPLAFVALLSLFGCGDSVFGPPARDITEFEARLEKLRADSHIPAISVAISKGQQIVWTKGFGLADVSRQATATPTTSYHLASLTKTFASTVIMQLVQEGKVSLDDPVSMYGIQLQSSGTVRVRHLLTHTSEGVPGTQFRYNGDRFSLLDSVIVHATGMRFAQAVEERIIRPLGLTHTAPNNQSGDFRFAEVDRDAFEANMAHGYTVNGSSQVATQYPTSFSTAAGLIASAVDMAMYSMAIDRDAFLRPETKALAFTPALANNGDALPYGLGWFVTNYKGTKLVWHYGLWTANSSLIIKVPDRQLTYVILANTSDLTAHCNVVVDLMDCAWARVFVDSFVTGDTPLP